MKIYVVTQGSYSDYHIVMATTDKDVAYEWVKIHNERVTDDWNTAEVNEYEDAKEKHYPVWNVWFSKTGVDVELSAWQSALNKKQIVDYESSVVISVEAKDSLTAIKIAQDLYAEHKAKKMLEE